MKVYSTAEDVANWFLSKESMTNFKLQVLVYYAYAYVLSVYNDDADSIKYRLFDDKFEAWVHNPAIPELFDKYETFYPKPIPKANKSPMLPEGINDILNAVWREYGKIDKFNLEGLVHQEVSWQNARQGYGPLDVCHEQLLDKDIFMQFV